MDWQRIGTFAHYYLLFFAHFYLLFYGHSNLIFWAQSYPTFYHSYPIFYHLDAPSSTSFPWAWPGTPLPLNFPLQSLPLTTSYLPLITNYPPLDYCTHLPNHPPHFPCLQPINYFLTSWSRTWRVLAAYPLRVIIVIPIFPACSTRFSTRPFAAFIGPICLRLMRGWLRDRLDNQ